MTLAGKECLESLRSWGQAQNVLLERQGKLCYLQWLSPSNVAGCGISEVLANFHTL